MWPPRISDRGERPGPFPLTQRPASPLPTPTTRSLQPCPTPAPCGSISALSPPHPQHPPPPRPPRPPYHTLRVHQQQVLGLPRVHAGEDVLPGVGDAVPHEEVPIRPKQFLCRPTAHLAMVPGLLTQLLLRGGNGGPAGRGTGPLILHRKGGCHGAGRHRAFMQPQGILEGSCGRGQCGREGPGLWGPAPSPLTGPISNSIYSLQFFKHMQKMRISFSFQCAHLFLFSCLVTLASFPMFIMPLVSSSRSDCTGQDLHYTSHLFGRQQASLSFPNSNGKAPDGLHKFPMAPSRHQCGPP